MGGSKGCRRVRRVQKVLKGQESVYPLDLLGRFWTLGALSGASFRELRFFYFHAVVLVLKGRRVQRVSKGQEGPKGVEGSGECLSFSPLRSLLDSWCSLGSFLFGSSDFFYFHAVVLVLKGGRVQRVLKGPKGVEGSGGSKGC